MVSELRVLAVIVVGHGSRREEANADVRRAAELIGARGGFALVEVAFLEIASPTIAEAFSRCVLSGATHVVVHPYFLSPGRHTRGDIPVEVQAAARHHPGITYQITEPLSAHSLVIDASIERIKENCRQNSTSDGNTEGKVYLVGAGPGDPGLLTIKAQELLRRAEVVVYDYLVNPDLLVHIPANAERIYVGKVGGGTQTPQGEINRYLIERANSGKLVVRLKGGDPFLFGRGGEEGQALNRAGIPFEVVPGVSSALAVPAYAGIPLTHRDVSSSVAILTGTHAHDSQRLEESLQRCGADTIVILMGLSHLERIVSTLIACGRATETPVAIIRWGTYESQQIVTGTLGNIVEVASAEALRAPVVIVVGEVVRLREELGWFRGIQSQIKQREYELVGQD